MAIPRRKSNDSRCLGDGLGVVSDTVSFARLKGILEFAMYYSNFLPSINPQGNKNSLTPVFWSEAEL